MGVSKLKRMFVAAAVITAVSFVGTSVLTNAQQQPQQDPKQEEQKKQQEQKKQEEQKKQHEQKKQQQGQQQEKKQQQEAQKQQQETQKQQQQAQPRQQRLPQPQQQQLIDQQQQRLAQYREHLDQQQRLAQEQAAQLQQQNRMAQYKFQQQYLARLREQQLSIQNARNYNYGGDPYFYTPPSYRYSRGGRYYQTNQYGVGLLRQAVNYGYEEGFWAGQADRQDRWAFNYRDSYAYRDGNYGYGGFYVERDDYNHYFREGFRRGYEDAYYGRYRYGDYATGRPSVLGTVLSVILSLEPLR